MSDVHGELTHPEDRLIGTGKEVLLPAGCELGAERLELLRRGSHLDAAINTTVGAMSVGVL